MTDDPGSRRLPIVLGIVAVGIGVLFVADTGLTRGFALGETVISILGLAALVQAVRAGYTRAGPAGNDRHVPAVEARTGTVVPGAEFDRALARRAASVRDRLRVVAFQLLTRIEELPDTAADDQLDEGEWTGDEYAAGFFSPSIIPSGRHGLRWPKWVGDEPLVVQQARRVVDELGRRVGLAQPEAAELGEPTADEPPEGEPSERPGAAAAHPSAGETAERLTDRWRGLSALALFATAVGLFVRTPSLLLVGAVGGVLVAYASYLRMGAPPAVSLSLARTVSEPTPGRDDEVTVTVTLRNDGERTLPDVRVVDGVPVELQVVDGMPRRAATLRPGETVSWTYTVRAGYGRHGFEPAYVLVRDVAGVREVATRVAADDSPAIDCRPPSAAAPAFQMRQQTTRSVGPVSTDIGGTGVEFYATREYRPGDSISLIDWNRLARTDTLATLEFREERAAAVMLVVDARRDAFVAPSPAARSAVNRAIEAADVLLETLIEQGNRVGLTALTPASNSVWLGPGGGGTHLARARDLLATHPVFAGPPASTKSDTEAQITRLQRRLSGDTQLVIISPLCDDGVVEIARTLDSTGHLVTVVSPDATADGTPGRQLAAIERRLRLAALREVGIPGYDWSCEDMLPLAFEREAKAAQVAR
jgi:uncharacterized repeat protein (TIGR01451 family)